MAGLRHIALAALFAAALGASAALAEEVSKLASFTDWSLYTDAKSPHAFCFLTSEPKSSEPADVAREAPRIYLSAWPKEGVKSELSVRLGFPAKKNTEILAAINGATTKLFGADDRAFIQDGAQEQKLVDAMRKGSKLVVTATTATGTAVADTYSLAGLGQAMQELQSTCF